MRRRRKTRIISLLISLLILAAASILPALGDKKKAGAEPYVLLAGTVFQETGFALPNAEVVVTQDAAPETKHSKAKKMQAVSDSRGEFALRLPAGNAHYVIKVSAKGFRDEEKPVTVQGEDRLDVTFQLHQESR
jgi:Carboxypeptidase regulatory-like domain